MKNRFTRALVAAFVAILAASFVAPSFGQAEKIKQKAKDLKKEVEGGKQATNKPPQAPKPPQTPQSPQKTPPPPAPPKPAK
jgi:cell division septum initiation protein DivIVA